MSAPFQLRLRPSLLLGCAACALLALKTAPASAQAFRLNPAKVFGDATFDRGTPGVETITVNSPTVVIDWSPGISDIISNPFVFLPAGNVATFQNGANVADFVALNRILVTVPVRFDGHVISQLVTASGTSRGGTLLFSTPGGIIVGANAVFDVGSLVLTTLSVNVDAAGNFYDPATRGFTFAGGLQPAGSVVTEAGARINALNPNSYVAFVAPTIDHAGNVQVNGAAAYVAGNQVEMRANDGLFDIVVPVGTDSATPITHSGITGGPASTGAADVHRIYMVAVPRSQAITAILTGNIGFDAPLSASVENGEIVLSAGYNVAGGAVDTSAPVNPAQAASLSIAGGTITSSLTGYAVTDAIAGGSATGQLHATQDLTLVGGRSAALVAGSGEVVTMDRNVTLASPGGSAVILASAGGSVTVGGNATVDATGTGISPALSGDATDGVGGEARIYSDGGTIRITGDATLLARGVGGHGSYTADTIGRGGNGYGGEVVVEGSNGGTVAIGGNLVADASGVGGFTSGYDASAALVSGATGEGGDVSVIGAGGGSVTVTGSSSLSSDGRGGRSIYTAGGTGTGDNVLIQASSGNVTLSGPVTISATGTGGQGASGGAGTGGELDIDAFRGNIRILGATTADLTGRGGTALTSAAGGNGTGGEIFIFAEADSGAVDILAFDGHADGVGATGSSGAAGGAGGRGQGGEIDVETSTDLNVVGARPGVHFGALSLSADGTGGAGGSGANGNGGAAGAGTGGEVTIAGSQAPIAVDGRTRLNASGTGGTASAGGGQGGGGTGGSILVSADRTIVALGTSAIAGADGRGGNGPTGGAGLGGSVQMLALGGTGSSQLTGGSVSASATGQGGTGADAGATTPAGRGGDGSGGTILMLADAVGGTIAFGATSANADGTGGAAGSSPTLALSGRGGDGSGGTAAAGTVENAAPNCSTPAACAAAATGSASFASLGLSAIGTGGQGGTGGNAGGGSATLQSVGAPTIVTGAATLHADAVAGAGTTPGGTAGQAFGGLLALTASPHGGTGTIGQIQAGSVTGGANSSGGSPGSTAGRWRVSASAGSSIAAANLTLDALGGGTLPAASQVNVQSGGTLNVSGTAALSSAGNIEVNASGAGKVLGGTFRLTAGHDVGVADVNPAADAVTIDVTDLAVVAGHDVSIAAGAVTRGANSTNVQAGNLATVAGRMLGRALQIASADIDLTGGIGDAATQSVTLSVGGASPPTQPTTLGGTTQGPGYTLTNAEAGRIRADTLQFNAPAVGTSANRNPDLVVGDLGFAGGGASAGIGTLRIVTPGIARVQGNLLLARARATDGISIAATQRLELVTPNGSVRVRDAAGAPGGTLTLTSNDIWAVSQAILDRLHADPAYPARDADLANNGGNQAPRGYLEGNSVTLNPANSLFVQNTGENPTNAFSLTGPAFAGITVGPGGLTIRATGATPASVTAFGRRINADGSTTIGYDFFFAVTFDTGAAGGGITGGANLIGPGGRAAGSRTGYTTASTFNTCIIVTGQCPLRRPDDTGPGGRDPITGPPGNILLASGASQDEPVDTSFSTEPLIEEPVTSGGESTLWSDPCPRRTGERSRRCDEVHP